MNAKKTTSSQVPGACKVLQDRGFALVITLSLMILLTLLLVGLLSLSTVALRTAAQGNEMAQARSNARIALILALGHLQKIAGPDQRVTAAADFAGDTGGLRLAASKAPRNDKSINNIANGLSVLKPGTRYWTGVWNSVTSTTSANQIYTKTPGATGVQWLISGNELDSTVPQSFTPASTLVALAPNGTVTDKTKAVVLVGAATVGAPAPATIDNYVSAPLVEITVPNPLGGDTRGRYAWWIGDEGVKAKFNRTASTAPNETATYQSLVTQRAGWEVVSQLANYPTPDSPRHALLERVVTLPEAKLLHPSLQSTAGTPTALFHAATTDSFGVLADSLNGGLRMDLTNCLTKGLPAAAKNIFPNAPAAGANIIPYSVAPTIKGPKWDVLKSFYDLAKNVPSGKLTVKGASKNTELTIAPIVVDLRMLMAVRPVPIDDSQYKLNPCGKIAISLANPYPYPLEWKSTLELEMIDETPTTNGRDTCIWGVSGQPAYFSNKGAPAVFNHAIFVIPRGELAPGEAKAFTNGGHVLRPLGDVGLVRVDLRPFASSSPANLENCLELEDASVNNGGRSLDVRESWITTQPAAELRLTGAPASASLLRRIHPFELDNGFFRTVGRGLDGSRAKLFTSPFPLQLYSYQMSQPGADYAALLPGGQAGGLMGTRSSTLRTFMDFNLRATRFGKLITSYSPPPYFMEGNNSQGDLPFLEPGGDAGLGFTRNLAVSPLAWGRAPVGNVKKTILFSFPKTFVSLAQLQHVDLTADDSFISICQQPGNAVGNSYATPFVKRKLTIQKRDNYIVTGSGGDSNSTSIKSSTNYYDMAYLLNAALWDSYFFSTLGEKAAYEPLNPSITLINRSADRYSLDDPTTAASELMINGAFNINSTNKDAWKALLAGNRFLKHPADLAATPTSDAMFPRSLEQRSPHTTPPTGTADDSFSGYRRLTSAQIDTLAEELVKQVRLRGPFVSLSHFINRALAPISSGNAPATALSRAGALQSAIDLSGANISPDGKKCAFSKIQVANTEKLNLQADAVESYSPRGDLVGAPGDPSNQLDGSRGTRFGGTTEDGMFVWAAQSIDLNPGSMASILADREMITDPKLVPEQGFRSTGIPGWLTQADVLQAIGPSLATRSDTFRIRAYGEALSPDGKTVLAKAWCEAVVQRLPNYVDPTDADSERSGGLGAINKLFGRNFAIVAFRWLAHDEI